MKKLIALILAVMLLCSTACAAEIDLSGMSLAELLELQQRVTMAMWETEEWQEVEVLDETERGAGGFGHTGKK